MPYFLTMSTNWKVFERKFDALAFIGWDVTKHFPQSFDFCFHHILFLSFIRALLRCRLLGQPDRVNPFLPTLLGWEDMERLLARLIPWRAEPYKKA
jgi:hypothetical protein